ncbi:MAG: TIGR00730 family Rossman fold protein [Ignavibacteria bacterium]|nr:TIGR00730 family Rossman fold protein [Ignavibacteria bacterium]
MTQSDNQPNFPNSAWKSADNSDRYFLEGPKSRFKEFLFVFNVMWEFIRGFRVLHFVGPCVTVFGSARFKEDHPYYQSARQMGAELSKIGFTVMTGGGPGIMEAANRGAMEAGGRSVGAAIILPMESSHNPYMDTWVQFKYFFVRKYLLFKYSYAFVVMPGGVGTMDEMFEALTLIQTKKVDHFPVILIGVEYYQPLVKLLESMADAGTIDRHDLDLVIVTDSIEEAARMIEKNVRERFAIWKKNKPKPSAILGEQKK